MDVDRAREKRQHAEREAHDETEEIKIRPGHTAPRAHLMCTSWNRDADHPHCKLVGSLRWRMSAAARAGVWLLSCFDAGPQNLAEPVRQARRAKNLREQQKRVPRILHLGNRPECFTELRIGRELLDSGVKPGIHLGVRHAQLGLQRRGVPVRVVHEKTGIDAEEAREQFARGVRDVRPGAALDLREVRLAEAAAHFAFHGLRQLELRHGTSQAAQGAFDGAEGTEFVAKSHGKPPIAICESYIAISNYVSSTKLALFSVTYRGQMVCGLFRLAEGLQIDSQGLALFVEMAALEAQRAGHIRHMKIVAADLVEQNFPFKRFGAFRECPGGI